MSPTGSAQKLETQKGGEIVHEIVELEWNSGPGWARETKGSRHRFEITLAKLVTVYRVDGIAQLNGLPPGGSFTKNTSRRSNPLGKQLFELLVEILDERLDLPIYGMTQRMMERR